MFMMTINNKNERNDRGKCLSLPATSNSQFLSFFLSSKIQFKICYRECLTDVKSITFALNLLVISSLFYLNTKSYHTSDLPRSRVKKKLHRIS